jgi:hypothetical protein
MRIFTLSITLPNSFHTRSFSLLGDCRDQIVSQAADIMRTFARTYSLSPLALEYAIKE